MLRVVLATTLGAAAVGSLGLAGTARPAASSGPDGIAPPAAQVSQLLGFAGARLVRVDSETLRALPGKGIAAGSGGCAGRQGGTACWSVPPWTLSPDGARLAIARNDASSLRLVDARRMRVTADVRLDGGPVGALAWLAGGRLLALQELGSERQRLVAVDLATTRVAARRALGGSVLRLGRTARELVMLLGPAQAIGPAGVAVADARGAVRSVRLRGILAGSKVLGTGSGFRVATRLPGLAVDRRGRRAFVVDKGVAAEVDLRSLTVSYHSLTSTVSWLGGLRSGLEPAAEAKEASRRVRQASWLGGGLLAVSGTDMARDRASSAGLSIVDTRGWRLRTLDRSASGFVVAGDLLLATGGDSDPATGVGVAAYGFDGARKFQLFAGESAWLAQVYGGRAYVGIAGQDPLRVVALATGRVVGERRLPLPWLVQGLAGSWWED